MIYIAIALGLAAFPGSCRAETAESAALGGSLAFESVKATVSPPKLQENAWDELLHTIGERGKYTKGAPYFDLPRIEGPKDGNHTADYASLWGEMGEDQKFHPYQVGLVHEDWKLISKDRFRFTQWIFILHMDGSMKRFRHGFVVEDKSGRVYETGELSASPEQIKAQLKRQLDYWYAFKPKGD